MTCIISNKSDIVGKIPEFDSIEDKNFRDLNEYSVISTYYSYKNNNYAT